MIEKCEDSECEERSFVTSFEGVISGNVIDGYECMISGHIPDYPEIESGEYRFIAEYRLNDDWQIEVIGSDSFDFIIDNTNPEMGVISPEEGDVYGELMPVSMYVTDEYSDIADESVKVRVYERGISLFGWDWCGLDGCDDTGWITLDPKGNDLYSTIINLTEYDIDGNGWFTVEAYACDSLYEPCDDASCNDDLGYLLDSRNTHHCTPIIDSYVEERTGCSDGWDNDFDGYTDYPDDLGCEDAEDNEEFDQE